MLEPVTTLVVFAALLLMTGMGVDAAKAAAPQPAGGRSFG